MSNGKLFIFRKELNLSDVEYVVEKIATLKNGEVKFEYDIFKHEEEVDKNVRVTDAEDELTKKAIKSIIREDEKKEYSTDEIDAMKILLSNECFSKGGRIFSGIYLREYGKIDNNVDYYNAADSSKVKGSLCGTYEDILNFDKLPEFFGVEKFSNISNKLIDSAILKHLPNNLKCFPKEWYKFIGDKLYIEPLENMLLEIESLNDLEARLSRNLYTYSCPEVELYIYKYKKIESSDKENIYKLIPNLNSKEDEIILFVKNSFSIFNRLDMYRMLAEKHRVRTKILSHDSNGYEIVVGNLPSVFSV